MSLTSTWTDGQYITDFNLFALTELASTEYSSEELAGFDGVLGLGLPSSLDSTKSFIA